MEREKKTYMQRCQPCLVWNACRSWKMMQQHIEMVIVERLPKHHCQQGSSPAGIDDGHWFIEPSIATGFQQKLWRFGIAINGWVVDGSQTVDDSIQGRLPEQNGSDTVVGYGTYRNSKNQNIASTSQLLKRLHWTGGRVWVQTYNHWHRRTNAAVENCLDHNILDLHRPL